MALIEPLPKSSTFSTNCDATEKLTVVRTVSMPVPAPFASNTLSPKLST